MPTNTLSDLATKQAAAKIDASAGVINGDDAGGIVLYATAKITIPATPAVSDTLTIIPAELLPVGAVVIPQLSHVYLASDPGTLLTIDIGLVSAPACFADDLQLTVPGNPLGAVSFSASTNVPAYLITPYRIAAQEAIIATVVTSTAVVATVAVFTIAYRAKG